MENVSCSSCGIVFGLPDLYAEHRRDDHATFHCPNGHRCHWPQESEAEKYRRERDRLAQQIAQKDDEIKRQRNLVIAGKAQVTKLKKRASAGVCPCCNRTFSNMARHMAHQHPEFDSKVVEFTKAKA